MSLRIEQLPLLSRLSKGHNNGDGSFSLKPDELHDIAYIPPEGEDGSGVTLAVRVIKREDDYASTLAVLDLSVLPSDAEPAAEPVETAAAPAPTVELRVPEKPAEPAEPAELEVLQRRGVEPPRAKTLAEAHVETQKLRRAVDVLSETLAKTEARAAHAEKMAEEAEALVADYVARTKDNKADTDRIRAEAAKEFEQKISQLQNQLDAASQDSDAANKQALEAAQKAHAEKVAELQRANAQALDQNAAAKKTYEDQIAQLQQELKTVPKDAGEKNKAALEAAQTEHARKIAELQATHARELEAQKTAATTALEQTIQGRLTEARREVEEKANAHLAEERRNWQADAETALSVAREGWQADEAKRLAEAKTPLEGEIADLRQKLETATAEIETVRAQTSAASSTAHAQEIAELQSAHAKALEEQAAATKEELEKSFGGRLADALRQAHERADAHLAEQQQIWKTDAETALTVAKASWQADAEKRRNDEDSPLATELASLREQLSAAQSEAEELRKQSTGAVEPTGSEEIATLKETHARELDAQKTETEKALEEAFEKRLAEALSEAEKKTEERLAEEHKAWDVGAEAALATARENWKADEEERLAAAKKEWQNKMRKEAKAWSRSGPAARRVQRNWMPRPSYAVAAVLVGLIVVAFLNPNIKRQIVERSELVFAEATDRVEPLVEIGRDVAAAPPELPDLPDIPAILDRRTTIIVPSANIRSGPSTATRVVGALGRGNAVVLLREQGEWWRIRFGSGDGDTGWVHRDLLADPS